MLGDGDTGWHIRIGEWIIANGKVPRTDIFSFTRPGSPFIAWEWLWDLGAAFLHQHFGLGGVVLASMLVLCTTFALVYRLAYRRCGNGIIALLITALAVAVSSIHFLARPHLMTWLFAVVFLTLIERAREGNTRLLWWLPLLTIVWTNLHGGFLAGIAILLTYGCGELLRAVFAERGPERGSAARSSLPYFAAAGASLAASLVNPYFYHLHQHLIEYLRDPYAMQHIVEFQSVNFHSSGAGFFEAMLALGFGAAIWFARKKSFGDVLLVAGWAHLALGAARHLPVYALMATPAIAVAVAGWLQALAESPLAGWVRTCADQIRSTWSEIEPFERIGRVHVVGLLALAGIALGMRSPSAGILLRPEYDRTAYPAGALALLENPGQRIFTHDEWGDYLVYNLWPKGGKVFIDGRSDFYGHDFCEQYASIMDVKYDWEQKLSQYHIDTILLPPDAALASAIKESSHWRVVYDDGSAIVFRPRASSSAAQEFSTSSSGGSERGLSITHQTTVITDHVNPKEHETYEKPANQKAARRSSA